MFNMFFIVVIVVVKIFCVYGGFLLVFSYMDDIRNIVRFIDVFDYGLFNDFLWFDLVDMELDWELNECGVSYCFGKKVIVDFLVVNDFDFVCCVYMVVEDGYEFFMDCVFVIVFSVFNVSCFFSLIIF